MPEDGFTQNRFANPQERVRLFFEAQCRRHGGRPDTTSLPHLSHPRSDGAIVRLGMLREPQTVRRILVAAINQGVIRQCGDTVQRVQHLSRRTFKQPSATRTEQRIAGKDSAIRQKNNMPFRMPRRSHHPKLAYLGNDKNVAIGLRFRHPVPGLCGRAENRNRVMGPECLDPCRMVPVVMCQQNRSRDETPRLDRRKNRRGFSQIDDGALPIFTLDEPDVIVIENGNRINPHDAGHLYPGMPPIIDF